MKKIFFILIAVICIGFTANAQSAYDWGYAIGAAGRQIYDNQKAKREEEARQERLRQQEEARQQHEYEMQQARLNAERERAAATARQAEAERQAEINRQAAAARQAEETQQAAARQAAQQQEMAGAIKAYNYTEKTLTLNDAVCFLKDADENCDLVFELLRKNGKYYIYAYNNYSSFLTLKANFMTIDVTYNNGTTKTFDSKLNKSFDANSELAIPVLSDEDLSNVNEISVVFDRSVLQ
ncbi:hypothetical protein FACS189434_11030 [Bacteroidia bacterium]|nr:hypothetical protein FACS189434_11030 [Bacteroidia bacterium]